MTDITKWKGGKCPVDGDTLVVCRLRNLWITKPQKASNFVWGHRMDGGHPGDITHWREARKDDL